MNNDDFCGAADARQGHAIRGKRIARRRFIAGMAASCAATAAGGLFSIRAMASTKNDRIAIVRAVFSADAAQLHCAARHVALINKMRVCWVPVESGAPGVYPLAPLLGKGTPEAIAMRVLKTDDEAFAIRTLAEACRLLPDFVAGGGTLSPGKYAIPAEMRKDLGFPGSGVTPAGDFLLQRAHLTLLRAALWRTAENDSMVKMLASSDEAWPAPFIDGKRPYGDRTYYQTDMASLLGDPYPTDAKGSVIEDPKRDKRYEQLHIETAAALQVFMAYARLEHPD